MTARTGTPWFVFALAALVIGAIVAAILVVGPASSGQAASVTRTVTARRGVVQSTVSGSGNIEPASELDLGFKTSGTVTQIDVSQGQHVVEGQLLATLDPQSAEVTLEQSKASLQSAEAALAREEETDGEGSGQSSASSGSEPSRASIALFVSTKSQPAATTSPSSSTSAQTPTATTPATTTSRAATPSANTPAAPKAPAGGEQSGGAPGSSSRKGTSEGSGSSSGASSGSGDSSSPGTSATGSSTATTLSTATREANLASARAAVKSDRLTVKSDEQAVADTRLIAPQDGTIVSLSGEVGETVSGGGTSRASSSSEGSSSSSSATDAAGLGAGAGSTGSSSSSKSGSSGSTGTPFAVLSDLSAMKLVVPLSESEVGSVKVGQPATVTIEALKGLKLAAHVSEVAALPTSNSGVVSYDVTFALDQLEAGLKAGMSATAEVVVSQAEGVNVPTSAISGGSVTVTHDGRQERRAVTTGLAGDSSTIILSGLQAGEQVVLPVASTSSATSLLSRLGGKTGGGTLGGGGLGGFGGGGFARAGALRGGPGG
jgi:multidrug efflux pump subunit AcrA (membrane-fusion protein)